MMALFRGHGAKSGTHGTPTQETGKLKWIIKTTARTLSVTPDEGVWSQHLRGERPLGVIAIMENNMCLWGSIDLDEYELDVPAVLAKVRATNLPLVPVRSKSGGMHFYGFMREPELAANVQSVLRDAAAAMGMARCEIFPKQTKLHDDRDAGSWMIMPYFGDGPLGSPNDGTFGNKIFQQVGLKGRGAEMTIDEFLVAAEKNRTNTADFHRRVREIVKSSETNSGSKKRRSGGASLCDFSDGPPCLHVLCGGQALNDGRKTVLFNASTYFKRADPDNWRSRLEDVNYKFKPPLPTSEILSTIKSAEKKDYDYTCDAEPLASYCNKKVCYGRKFGKGNHDERPSISLRRLEIDPVIWIVDVEGDGGKGGTFEMNNHDLFVFAKFQEQCSEKLTRCFELISQKEWTSIVRVAMDQVEESVPAPLDLSASEVFREHLEKFLTHSSRGDTKYDLLADKPWEDEENGRHYFKMYALTNYFKRNKIVTFGGNDEPFMRREFRRFITNLKGGLEDVHLEGRAAPVKAWWIPSSVVRNPLLLPPPPPRDAGDEI